ncbi:MAG TPA: hypothetical protein PK155_07380 [Bacteroidales bacterium]|jgi:hypothetical protein|nr:hypothetical protein [Bacteroidales bacterium]
MAISEKLCWEVLRMANGQSVYSEWLKGGHCQEPPLQNAIPLFVLERELVLRYQKNQIEDSLYFLEKRGYLLRHGFQGLTRVAFQLSDSGLEALKKGSFSPEEQRAFREALLDVRQPGLYGMKLNLGEVLRRLRKWLS